MAEQASAGQALDAHGNDLNAQIRYTMWSVYRVVPGESAAAPAAATVVRTLGDGVVLRGAYDVGGLRADADLMLWWHAPERGGAAGGLPNSGRDRRDPAGAGVVADGAAPSGRVQPGARAGLPRR